MSKDIRSYFGGGGAKVAKKPTPLKESTAKRKAVIISDDDEEQEVQTVQKRPAKSEMLVSKKRRVIESDEEPSPQKKRHDSKPNLVKLKPVNVADVFSSAPVKRVEQPKHAKKKSQEVAVDVTPSPQIEIDVIPGTPSAKSEKRESASKHRKSSEKSSPEEKVSPRKKATENNDRRRSSEGHREAKKESKVEPKSPVATTPKPKQKTTTSPDKERTPSSSKKDPNESILTDEERHERKRMSAILYQKFKNRQGPANPGSKEIPQGTADCLSGMQFVITGVLESMERDECAQVIKDCGGKVVGAISKKVTHMVVGADAGPKKLAQADDMGIQQMSEDDLIVLIKQKSGLLKAEKSPKVKDSKQPKEETPTKRKLLEEEPAQRRVKVEKVTPQKLSAREEKKSPRKAISKESSPLKRSEPVTFAPAVKVEPTEYQQDIKSLDNMAWVDKYKPTSTKQIIGQVGTASNVSKLVTWLTNWHSNNDGKKKHARPNPWAKNQNGDAFRAALLSGPPGVGKTTTATLVCKELGFDTVEFNASDTRSKRLLKEEVSELLGNKTLFGYFDEGRKLSSKHVLLMDEVDGMAGNEDRGGMQELIALIKESHVPVICMCNDRNHPKIRSLVNYCYDLRFNKPRVEQIKGAMMSVCFKEGLKLAPGVLEEIISGTGGDVRQTLNHLALYSAEKTSAAALTVGRAKNEANAAKKDVKMGPWDVIRKVFSAEDHKQMSMNDKSDLFFHDYSIAPLFVQENYLKVQPKAPREQLLQRVARTADSLSMGDLVDRRIRSNMAWSLLPLQAMYSSVLPGEYMEGHFAGQIKFPEWLGKYSRANKRKRLAQEIHDHTRIATSGSRLSVRLDYAPFLVNAIVRPLQTSGVDGVGEALAIIKEYRLLREDLDSLIELSSWPKRKSPMDLVDPKVKAALTRAYNKEIAPYSYSVMAAVKKKRSEQLDEAENGMYGAEGEEGTNVTVSDEEKEDDDLDNNAFIKVKKKAATGSSGASSKTTASKAKGSNAGSSKGRKK